MEVVDSGIVSCEIASFGLSGPENVEIHTTLVFV